jgi:hypothetical protein
MGKIKNIGKAEIIMIGEELETVIQKAMNKYGLTATRTGVKYGGHTGTFSFKLDVPAMAEKIALNHARLLGANFSIGYEFVSNGENFKVMDFNLRRHKYPVSADNLRTGKSYKFTVDSINRKIEIVKLFEQSRAKDKVTA